MVPIELGGRVGEDAGRLGDWVEKVVICPRYRLRLGLMGDRVDNLSL